MKKKKAGLNQPLIIRHLRKIIKKERRKIWYGNAG